MKDLGLGGLLQLKIQQHRNRKIEELMKRFDPATRKLGVHGRELVITEDDVERILGLAGGRKDISRLNSKLQELRQKCKMRKDTRKELIANMEGIENNEEWQANFILLSILSRPKFGPRPAYEKNRLWKPDSSRTSLGDTELRLINSK